MPGFSDRSGITCSKRVPVRVRGPEARRRARARDAHERVDGLLLGESEVRGLLLERDRNGRRDERQAESVEPGDERGQLLPERAQGERHVERVLAERLEIRVVERGRERVRHAVAEEREESCTPSVGGRCRRPRRGPRAHLSRRGRAPGDERAEGERRAEVRREDARREPRPPPSRTPRDRRTGARPAAREGAGRPTCRSRSRRASRSGRRKRASGQPTRSDRQALPPCHGAKRSS